MKNLLRPGVLSSNLNVLLPFDKDTWIFLLLTLFSLGVILPVLFAAASNTIKVFYKKNWGIAPLLNQNIISQMEDLVRYALMPLGILFQVPSAFLLAVCYS